MTTRLLLIRHAATAATRRAVFADDGPITDRARARAEQLANVLPRPRQVTTSPARCALDTAEALWSSGAVVDGALADWDLGRWAGATLEDVRVAEPAGVEAWLTDPAASPHGGERLLDVLGRVEAWLGAAQHDGGTRAAVTHAANIRAAAVLALAAPPAAFWSIDVAPTSVTELRWREGGWRVAHLNWEPTLIHVPRPAKRGGKSREVASAHAAPVAFTPEAAA